jgi:GH15 family glucan-1,4-alpha-glucosidase
MHISSSEALNRLGTTETMEAYINYIVTMAADLEAPLRPLHSIVPGGDLEESISPDLTGFLGQGPVRIGNAAALQNQHDVYGRATTQMFVDDLVRLEREGG